MKTASNNVYRDNVISLLDVADAETVRTLVIVMGVTPGEVVSRAIAELARKVSEEDSDAEKQS